VLQTPGQPESWIFQEKLDILLETRLGGGAKHVKIGNIFEAI
jgi:hypothetical protein